MSIFDALVNALVERLSATVLGRRLGAIARHGRGGHVAVIIVASYFAFAIFAIFTRIVCAIGHVNGSDRYQIYAGVLGSLATASLTVIWMGGQAYEEETQRTADLQNPDSRLARLAHSQDLLLQARVKISQALTDTSATIRTALESANGITDALQEQLTAADRAFDEVSNQMEHARQEAADAKALAALAKDNDGFRAVRSALDLSIETGLAAKEISGRRWDLKLATWTLVLSIPICIATGVLVTRL